jgi:hypothetical protein
MAVSILDQVDLCCKVKLQRKKEKNKKAVVFLRIFRMVKNLVSRSHLEQGTRSVSVLVQSLAGTGLNFSRPSVYTHDSPKICFGSM